MLIANPIYDAVFKYLMEDIEIARGLLGTIIGQEITELVLQPQETTAQSQLTGQIVKIYRLDFTAIIKQADGSHRKVLIELQKSKHLADIMRFRRYLAQNYQKEDEIINASGEQEHKVLPIVTIYFLGFKLKHISVPVLKVNNCYYDVIRGEPLEKTEKEDFIELLNHESYTIQIPKLKNRLKTRLEKVLMIFSQDYSTEDRHQLDFGGDDDDPLLKKMLRRLHRVVSDPVIRQQMDIEDEMERIYNRELKVLYDKVLEQDKVIEEKKKDIEEKDQAIEALRKQIEELRGKA